MTDPTHLPPVPFPLTQEKAEEYKRAVMGLRGCAAGDAAATTDPVSRERAARDELARLSALVSEQSATRRAALLELYSQLGTWAKVAEATGLELGTAYKAAR